MCGHRPTAGALTKNSDLILIAAKQMYVFSHLNRKKKLIDKQLIIWITNPFESQELIIKTHITRH